MFNKRGQDLSVGTLVLIIIGVVVLVLVVLGFTMGWDNLLAKFNIFTSEDDLSGKIQACALAVTQNSISSFCTYTDRVVKVDGQQRYINCEYPKVKESLKGGVLSCPSSYEREKCVPLLLEKFKSTTKTLVEQTRECDTLNKSSSLTSFPLVNGVSCGVYCSLISNPLPVNSAP